MSFMSLTYMRVSFIENKIRISMHVKCGSLTNFLRCCWVCMQNKNNEEGTKEDSGCKLHLFGLPSFLFFVVCVWWREDRALGFLYRHQLCNMNIEKSVLTLSDIDSFFMYVTSISASKFDTFWNTR